MRYTALRVSADGVVLFDRHRARLAAHDATVGRLFDEFAASAEPRVYVVRVLEGRLQAAARGPTALHDGMPVRYLPSPVHDRTGRFPKPAPPSPYDGVRLAGWCTALTDVSATELLESCTAALLAWDGKHLVVPPDQAPRVQSVAEEEVRATFGARSESLLLQGEWPIAAINAVAGLSRPAFLGRGAFPDDLARRILTHFESTARRP